VKVAAPQTADKKIKFEPETGSKDFHSFTQGWKGQGPDLPQRSKTLKMGKKPLKVSVSEHTYLVSIYI
jgi:hypothetical protein